MATPTAWMRYLRFLRPDSRADVDDEVSFHLEMRRSELEARGWPPGSARAEAERIFGDVGAITNACLTIDERRRKRRARREELGDMMHDLHMAARSLLRTPAFTIIAVVCIALGIAVTTTIFSAVNGVLLQPLPYPRAERLVALYSGMPDQGLHGANISYPDFLSWRDETESFTSIGIWTWTTHTLSGEGDAERVDGAGLSPELLPLLGVRPLLGRVFSPDEDPTSRARVVILGHDLWRRRYGGDSAIVGRGIIIDQQPYTVIGVMPPRFSFPERGQLWVPFNLDDWGEGRGNRGYAGAIGRLAPGATLESARADLATLSSRLQREYPRDSFGWVAEALSLREDLVGPLRRALLVFVGAVALVLLISCANVANLMLARGAARQREVAVRVALGAGRGRVVRQVLTESVLLALAAGALGTLLAGYGVQLLRLAFPDDPPFYISLRLDAMALAFTLVLSTLVGIVAGAVPALRATRIDLGGALREGGRGDVGGRGARIRNALVVAEIALAVVLLVSATLLVRSYRALLSTDLGFDTRGILAARVSLPPAKYDTPEKRLAFWDELHARLRRHPGIERVGSANGTPFSGWDVQAGYSIEGRPAPRQGEELIVHYQWVTPDYFAAIGVPLLRGRMLSPADRDSDAHIAVINEVLARREFAGQDPIGKRMKVGEVDSKEPWITVVGVVGEFRHYRLPQPMGPAMYYPMLAYPAYTQTLAIRTRAVDPLQLEETIRQTLRSLDPDVPAYQVRSFEQVVARSLWQQRLQSQVLGAFSALALLLAAAGIYGVISYVVAQRTRELGVRVALGATKGRLVRLVVGQAARMAIFGISIGLVVALAVTRALETLLYGVTTHDVATFAGVPLVLGAVALMASLLPAFRATRIDPATAMRAE
jgi:putative ABC transport system permease protein